MSKQNFYMEQLAEDKILQNHPIKDLTQLQNKDMFSPTENLPLEITQKNASLELGTTENGEEEQEDINDDLILAGLSAEELEQLKMELDMIVLDDRTPVETKPNTRLHECVIQEEQNEEQDDINEDIILAGLSAEELRQLQNEMEVIAPDERMPVGMRQKDQTTKPPTGSFDHRSLVDYLYWERKTKRLLEEERIPTTLLFNEKKSEEQMQNKVKENNETEEQTEYVHDNMIKQANTEEEENQSVKITNRSKEKVKYDSEKQKQEPKKIKEESIVTAATNESNDQNTEDFIVHRNENESTADERKQEDQNKFEPVHSAYENWLPEKEKRVIAKLKIPKIALGDGLIKKTARPSGNDTNLEGTLKKIRNQNPSITEVNLNNIENMPKVMLLDYVEALKKNKHVKTFSIANTGADETVAFSLANMLRENKSITNLNIESNFITGKGIIAIMRCLQFNETLLELRFHNQIHMLGHQAEMEVSRLLKFNNTLLKIGYHFELPGPRMVVTNLLTRNLDQQRQKRIEQQRLQQLQEQQQQIAEMYKSTVQFSHGVLEMGAGHGSEMEFLQASQHIPQDSPETSIFQQQHKTYNGHQQNVLNLDADPVQILRNVQLKKTHKCRDTNLALIHNKGFRNDELSNMRLHSTSKTKSTSSESLPDDSANLKDVIKALKPVPRRRQPPKVELTPRDLLLSEIRQSNVAYLKAVPLPKSLESLEPSLF